MSIPIWDVFRQQGYEISGRILRAHPHLQSLIFEREPDGFMSDLFETVLGDRWPTSIPARISQEVFFRLEVIDVDAPPPIFSRQDCFEIGGMQIGFQYAAFQRISEERDYGESPHVHQLLPVKLQSIDPTSVRIPQASGRNENMQVRVEVESCPEGVGYHHN